MAQGIEAYIADLSMNMAQQSVSSAVGTKMLKNVMDSGEQTAAQLTNMIENAPSPTFGEAGGLLDVMA